MLKCVCLLFGLFGCRHTNVLKPPHPHLPSKPCCSLLRLICHVFVPLEPVKCEKAPYDPDQHLPNEYLIQITSCVCVCVCVCVRTAFDESLIDTLEWLTLGRGLQMSRNLQWLYCNRLSATWCYPRLKPLGAAPLTSPQMVKSAGWRAVRPVWHTEKTPSSQFVREAKFMFCFLWVVTGDVLSPVLPP